MPALFVVCLLKLLYQLFNSSHTAAAVGAGTGGFLNSFKGGIASLNGCLDITDSYASAEAYGFL